MPPNSELKGHVQPDTRPKPKTKPPASPKMPKHTQEIFESEDGQKFLETQAKKEQKKMMAAKREAEREAQFTQQGGGSGSEMPADFFNPNNQRKAKKSVAESAKARKSRKIQIVYVDGEETEFSCSDSDSDVPGGNTTAKSVPVGSKKANVTTAKGKKSKVIKPNVAKTKVTKSRAPKQSGKGVEDVESNLEPEPAASGEGKKGAKKPRAKPKVKTESEIVNAKASRDFVAAAKTMAESLAKMSEEGRAKAVLGKQFYTVLGTASGSDGAKKALVASTAMAVSQAKDTGPVKREKMGKRSYKEAFEQAMKSVDSDEEVFVPTSKHKFQYLEPETIAAASGKTIDDFIKDCLESTSPKPRAGKLVPISEEIIHKVLDFTRTLDIHVLAAKVMNLLKNARKSPFLTVNERFEIPENERIGLMLTKSSDQKYLSDFMQATAKAALARGEYENWKKWCRACDPIRFDKMSASQLESKRMLEAGTYYQNVSDRDKSGTLSDKIVTRYAHTGRRWLNYGRILCAGSSKAEGAILALIVCETPKLSSQLDLIQKRFNETHMFVFDKWVAEREPELTAFCVFLEPFAISLHAGKVGSMVRVEKKFKEFLAALPKRRYNFAPIPNEEYVPDDEDEDGSELDEDEDGPEHDEDGVKVPYAQVKIQHDQEDGEPTTGIADAVIGLSVNASNIAPSAESILPAPIGANSPSNRGINGLDETASDAEPSAKQIAVANGGGNIIVSQPTPEHATESNQQQTELIHEPLTHDPNDLVLQTSLQAALNSMDRNAASGEEPWDKFVEYPDT